MVTKNKNLKVFLLLWLLSMPFLALASDDDTSSNSDSTMISTWVNFDFNLKAKIDWNYKVILKWNDVSSKIEDFQNYFVILSSTPEVVYPNTSSEQVFTVTNSWTEFVDYHSVAWNNYYRVFWINSSWDVFGSNVAKISMDWNWAPVYDVNYGSWKSSSWAYKEDRKYRIPEWSWALYWSWKYSSGTMKYPQRDFSGSLDKQKYLSGASDIKNENREAVWELKYDLATLKSQLNLTDDKVTSFKYLMTTLETQLKALRESITMSNLDESKAKFEELKTTFLAKVKEIDDSEKLSKIVETRFEIFNQNQFVTREKMAKLKENNKSLTWVINSTKTKTSSSDLVSKYKTSFEAKIWTKLDSYSKDKLDEILTKLTILKSTYQSNSSIDSTKKQKFLAQIEALISIINDKIDAIDNQIDLEDIIN